MSDPVEIWRDRAYVCLETLRQANDRCERLELRLATVPALVAALKGFVEPDPHTDGYGEIERGAAALAAWEATQ